MDVLDWILVVIRWSHALGAVAWVGGGIFYIMVLRPVMARTVGGSPGVNRAIGAEFRGLVTTAIAILLITGTILSVDRLVSDAASLPYVTVLVVKIVMAVYMFYVVRFLRQRVYPEEPETGAGKMARLRGLATNTTAVLVMGLVVFGLSDVLDALFENGLEG